MTQTTRLALPLIASEQAKKHVTHNEALLHLDGIVQLRLVARDQTAPPADPVPGDTYALGTEPEDAWEGQGGALASWTAGGWRFATPQEGWLAWDATEVEPLAFRDGEWAPLLTNASMVGVGTAADATNRLAVCSEAALFTAVSEANGGNGNVRLTVNKETAADSGTMLFQAGYSGRAEIGLAGNDDFSFKVSADGVAFATSMTLAADTGFVSLERLFGATPGAPQVEGGVLVVETSCVVPVPEAGSADDIDTISGGFDGALLIVFGAAGLTLTLKDGTGNLALGTDRTLDGAGAAIMLVHRDGTWLALN